MAQKRKPNPKSLYERLAIPPGEVGQFGGWGRNKTYELIKAGKLETVKVDSRRLVIVDSLLRLLGLDRKAA
jgi:hypothetical protein